MKKKPKKNNWRIREAKTLEYRKAFGLLYPKPEAEPHSRKLAWILRRGTRPRPSNCPELET